MERHPRDSQGELASRPSRVAYWLIPAASALPRLQLMINQLARQYHGPRFEPHVTIYAGRFGPADNPSLVLEAAARSGTGIVLPVQGLCFSPLYTKSCFLQLGNHEGLTELCERFRRLSQHPGDYTLDPHLSLLYANLDHGAHAEIAAQLVLPQQIPFDQIWAVSIPGQVRGKADVERWRLMATHSLLSRAS